MDITLVFKACVKIIKTRNRAFGETTGDSEKSKILSPRHGKCEITARCREVVQQITRLRDFLAEHRQAYLNFSNHLPGVPQMSDFERDKIDAGAQRIINACSNYILDLEREVAKRRSDNSQVIEHQQIIVALMKDYLKQVCKMYTEQSAIRVQRSLEMKNMSRLNSSSPKKSAGAQSSLETVNAKEGSPSGCEGPAPPAVLENEALSVEELQMFELENQQLYNELNCLTDEISQIERKVVKIAELQEMFTEKVLEQDKDIDRITTTVIGTTENVKDANEQIRQAIQRNAGLRVWILFFLLVISFSLLFLDWYND